MRIPFLIVSMSLLAGCSIGLKPQGAPLRPESVGKILLRVVPENLDKAQTPAMAERISKNLSSWGYPVEAEQSEDVEIEVTHEMTARVGSVENKGTPTGFSFSIGNSDPRALGFQKADVLPVTCTLKSTARSSETASLFMDFIADEKVKDSSRARNDPALLKIFENHIGTVCFNLLDKLKVPRKKSASSTSTSTWMPEIRIEVTEKPAKSETGTSTGALPVLPAGTDRPTNPEAPISEVDSSSPPEEPPVTTETSADTEEGRKRIIIHNRGNPVILDFGFERK
ncbi:uncharacterized protein sS8_2818 [Methylocaldum marinum]|uniref:Lipoprotein n=1 Tax=Methylocaldum marinum TaxID=1432792 RepID=A0A250KSV1_9GAMM|nr:hypothetical protein [Methylocaldum marinum]BBA34763.1 uncharacterized protein sS8_2818 [Methylocaldum marinum]